MPALVSPLKPCTWPVKIVINFNEFYKLFSYCFAIFQFPTVTNEAPSLADQVRKIKNTTIIITIWKRNKAFFVWNVKTGLIKGRTKLLIFDLFKTNGNMSVLSLMKKINRNMNRLHNDLPVSPLWLTRSTAAQILQPPDNLTSPPSGIRWRRGRWYRLDQPVWSTYTPHCCRGHRRCCLQHHHLLLHQESHRRGNQSWRWGHWSPSGCRRMCPPLSVTKERRGRRGRKGQQTHITTHFRTIASRFSNSWFRQGTF